MEADSYYNWRVGQTNRIGKQDDKQHYGCARLSIPPLHTIQGPNLVLLSPNISSVFAH
ncbi:hypothetical protein J1N35_013783 [Gossypium stocksii]|uniref:Uncharacterized protein n=1 Tax=Gossypium stocksii TaxID=47602 RepID=A0A9D4A9B0_9ROSI|nr:hypothetical protein J1N35_013783 [Gossypium stocksii]